MKRKIIKIDEDRCNGCGLCIPNCPEGALQIVDGKARMVSELSCDGLGACIGHCPQDAITIEEREAEQYDELQVIAKLAAAGPETVKAHLEHLREHNETEYLDQAIGYLKKNNIEIPETPQQLDVHVPPKAEDFTGCPGMKMIDRSHEVEADQASECCEVKSQLKQWPVQLKLLNPHAPYFKGADLLVAADCCAFSYGNFHADFMKSKTVIIFCPKLDEAMDAYIEKLAAIFRDNDIKSITIARMEVPCCGGVTRIVDLALEQSGKNIEVIEHTITLNGELL